MSKNSEIKKFESRFSEEIFEIAAITAFQEVDAGKSGKDKLWRASINLIAGKI